MLFELLYSKQEGCFAELYTLLDQCSSATERAALEGGFLEKFDPKFFDVWRIWKHQRESAVMAAGNLMGSKNHAA